MGTSRRAEHTARRWRLVALVFLSQRPGAGARGSRIRCRLNGSLVARQRLDAHQQGRRGATEPLSRAASRPAARLGCGDHEGVARVMGCSTSFSGTSSFSTISESEPKSHSSSSSSTAFFSTSLTTLISHTTNIFLPTNTLYWLVPA